MMLERIEEVQGIGLLYRANGKIYKCQKATFIYADNGRGKSTLASIFRSLSTGDASLITSRKTVDGTDLPKVALQFGSGHKVTFDNGAWSEQRSEVLVFDADFIERNVHSGGTVNTGHRKNLLEFALGEPAVAARLAVEKATSDAKVASDRVQGIVGQLSGYLGGTPLGVFEKLSVVADADVKIAELQKRISAANNVAAITARAVPSVVVEPSLNIDQIFAVLSLSLKDVHADAEQIVREHVGKLDNKNAEIWISQGQQFESSKNCPYCAQDVSSNDLIRAYQTHFNAAYGELKDKVSGLVDAVDSGTAQNIIENFAKSVAVAASQAATWSENVETSPIVFDSTTANKPLVELRNYLSGLVKLKQLTPTDPIGNEEEKKQARSLWQQTVASMRTTNAEITAATMVISQYKGQLVSDNIVLLQQQVAQIQASKRRHEPVVNGLINNLVAARSDAELAEKTKKTARENLDALMQATLNQYEVAINALLKSFGASFSIKGMSGNFRGAAPRSEYGLLLRGKDVSLEGGPPSFSTALSEGDKRTLAFAFFVASTLADPKLAGKVVVIDDPMCSLDLNRRHHTRVVLRKIHGKAEQLIVLAHDPYFLLNLRDFLLREDKTVQIANFQLLLGTGDYSTFGSIDLDKECESDYFRHHRMLNELMDGKNPDARAVAKAIRPMLEGYLHRRFPGRIPKDILFGQVVILIRDAQAPSPLCHAQGLVAELNEINDYAGQFHHDTNPSADSVPVVASELKTFVERALEVVHRGVK